MSREAEKTLFGLLIDIEEITTLAMEGLPLEAIPSEELRPIFEWALNYFHQGGRKMPPTIEAFKATEMIGFKDSRSMFDVLGEYDIEIGELPDQHMLWAIEELKATYLKKTVQDWSKETSRELTEVPSGDTHGVLAERATQLVGLSLDLESHQTRVELRETASDILADYEERKSANGAFRGMAFGLQEVDEHSNGIYPGEIAILGAYAKVGKSYFVDRVALKEWERGRSVALFTLENSLEMTRDRIACLATGVNPTHFEQGISLPDEELMVQTWIHDVLEKSDTPLNMLAPEGSERSLPSWKPSVLVMHGTSRSVRSFTTSRHSSMGRETRCLASSHTR
jgi:replicative DNA helicase